jgi:serine/threonine-protein kinase RsbW
LATATPLRLSPPVPAAITATRLVRAASDLPRVLDPVAAAMAGLAYPRRDILGVRLALEEALANALKHGHRGDPAKAARVRYRVTANEVTAEVADEGPGFDPGRVADPRAEENLGRPCGRGLLLMRHYMTWVRFNDRGNAVTLCKCRPAS